MSMFGEFRRAWREAVDNFWHELEADTAPGEGAVYRQVAEARNQLERLDRQIAEARHREKEERREAEVCRRRERMAREIGDDETAGLAGDFAARHAERADVLGRKAEALEAERALCRRDLTEMERALQSGRVASDPRPELEDLNRHPSEGAFRDLEDNHRSRSAAERLEELKRRMDR